MAVVAEYRRWQLLGRFELDFRGLAYWFRAGEFPRAQRGSGVGGGLCDQARAIGTEAHPRRAGMRERRPEQAFRSRHPKAARRPQSLHFWN